MNVHQLATQYVAGVDLHKRSVTICIMDLRGNIILERTFGRRKTARLSACLAPYGTDITIGVEATFNWYWLSDWCDERGIPCVLGHPLYLRRKAIGKNKSDRIDARHMATLLRLNDFPCTAPYPLEWRATRDLARQRTVFTAMQTALKLRRGCIEEQHLLSERHELLLNGGRARWYADVWTGFDTAEPVLDVLAQQIRAIEQRLEQQGPLHFPAGYALLSAVHGIGTVLASTVLYEIGALERFPTVQDFSSYCRVVTPQCDSDGKRVGYGNVRSGNPYLCWALHFMVETTRRRTPQIESLFKELKRRRGLRDAHRILAHQWAVTIYFMLKNQEPFSLERFLYRFRGTVAQGAPIQCSGHAADVA